MNYYVYIYRDPKDGRVFYVGKGKGERAFSHLKKREKNISLHNDDLACKIDEILKSGKKPQIEIVEYFNNEADALLREAAIIEEIGIINLSNKINTPWPPIMPPDVIAKRANTCKNNPSWRATITSKEHREKLSLAVKKSIQERGGRQPLSSEHRQAVSRGCKGKQSGMNNPMSKNTPEQIFKYLTAVMNGGHWKETARKMQISNAWNVVQRNAWQSVEPPPGYKIPPNRKKLTVSVKGEIVLLHESGMSRNKIAEITGFSTTAVSNVIKKH